MFGKRGKRFTLVPHAQIAAAIEAALAALGRDCALLSFRRDHVHFGNMVAVVRCGGRERTFISDRGDVLCEEELVAAAGNHTAGVDDRPAQFVAAIARAIGRDG